MDFEFEKGCFSAILYQRSEPYLEMLQCIFIVFFPVNMKFCRINGGLDEWYYNCYESQKKESMNNLTKWLWDGRPRFDARSLLFALKDRQNIRTTAYRVRITKLSCAIGEFSRFTQCAANPTLGLFIIHQMLLTQIRHKSMFTQLFQ